MSRSSEGRYSDGKTAGSDRVQLTLGMGALGISFDEGAPRTWLYEDLDADPKLARGTTSAVLRRTSDASESVFVSDAQFLDALRKVAPATSNQSYISRWLKIAAVILVIVGSGYLALQAFNLSPARAIAEAIPQSLRVKFGQQLESSFVRQHGRCNSETGDAALQALFDRIVRAAGAGEKASVMVINWKLVNGFAGPGNRIFLTQGLIQAAQTPEEVAGVLAHELGHARALHPETGIVRGLGIGVFIEFLTGGSGGGLSNVGAVLLQQRYTRAAEAEADELGLSYLRNGAISKDGLIAFFKRLQAKHSDKTGKSSAGKLFRDVLSTHPATEERISRLEKAEHFPTRPAMSPAEWAALRKICTKVSRP